VDGKGLRGFARDPFAVDEHLVRADFGLDSAGHHGLPGEIVPSLRDSVLFFTAHPGLPSWANIWRPFGLELRSRSSIASAICWVFLYDQLRASSCELRSQDSRRRLSPHESKTNQHQRRTSLAGTGVAIAAS